MTYSGAVISLTSPYLDRSWRALISASLLSHDLYVKWQKAPVVTDLKDTNKQVRDLEFPSVTICTEGINMEAVLNTLDQDFSDWLERNGISEDNNPNMDTALKRFVLETFNLQPSEQFSLEDIVLAYSSSNPDQSLILNTIIDTMITCSEQEECEEEDQQCNARDNSWKSRTECSGNILERMNLIDEEKPIIDLFAGISFVNGFSNSTEH